MESAKWAALGVQVLSLLCVWLRLWWQVRRQQAHREYVVTLVSALPEGSTLDDRREGGVLRLKIVPSPPDVDRGQDVVPHRDG